MICVTEIKVVDVERDFLWLAHMENMPPIAEIMNSAPKEYAEVKKEIIQGEQFVNAYGQRFCIGMSKQVREAIGLPFEVFKNMHGEIEQLQDANAGRQERIVKFNAASFWKRLWYVLNGYQI